MMGTQIIFICTNNTYTQILLYLYVIWDGVKSTKKRNESKMKLSEFKEVVREISRKKFYESLNEASKDFKIGKQAYTNRGLTPVDIHQLAMEFIKTPHSNFGKKDSEVVSAMKDLLALTGKGLAAKVVGTFGKPDKFKIVKSNKPALILHLLKNNLVDKKEYVDIYKQLNSKLEKFLPKFQNNDLANRRQPTGAAKSAAKKDMDNFLDTFGKNSVVQN